MNTWAKKLFAFAVLAFGLVTVVDATTTYYKTVMPSTRFTGPVLFEQEVTFNVPSAITGATTISADDLELTDDLSVGDDATITGDLAITGALTSVGSVTSPLVYSATARVYHGTKTLTEAGGAETVFTVTNATTQATGGRIFYTIRGNDGTDTQNSSGTVVVAMVNKAGTVTATQEPDDVAEGVTAKTAVQALSSGTSTCVFAFTAGANSAAFTANLDSSLTLTSASMEWVLILEGPGTVS